MDRPFALFLTWTCYGTWLPGDERGYVSRTFEPIQGWQDKQNQPGTPFTSDHAPTRRLVAHLQRSPTFLLDDASARVAASAMIDSCLKRGWRIVRGAIMNNHVHLLVMNCPNDGPTVRRIVKGTSQARLNDFLGANQRRWTVNGSDRYLNDWASIERVGCYIERQEGILVEIRDNLIVGEGEVPTSDTAPAG